MLAQFQEKGTTNFWEGEEKDKNKEFMTEHTGQAQGAVGMNSSGQGLWEGYLSRWQVMQKDKTELSRWWSGVEGQPPTTQTTGHAETSGGKELGGSLPKWTVEIGSSRGWRDH